MYLSKFCTSTWLIKNARLEEKFFFSNIEDLASRECCFDEVCCHPDWTVLSWTFSTPESSLLYVATRNLHTMPSANWLRFHVSLEFCSLEFSAVCMESDGEMQGLESKGVASWNFQNRIIFYLFLYLSFDH